jgi:CO/xanthine dehydrogenase Mo-binding subunit
MQAAAVKVEAEYRIPINHHNPIEPHAAIAFWQGDQLTIFDKTQKVLACRSTWQKAWACRPRTSAWCRRSWAALSAHRSSRTTTRR